MGIVTKNPYTNAYAREMFELLQVHYEKYKTDTRKINKVATILNDFCNELAAMSVEERAEKEKRMQINCSFDINVVLNIG